MKKKKQVFKINDIVRIKNPEFVIRVGYPWDKEYVKNSILTAEDKERVAKLMLSVGIAPPRFGLEWEDDKCYRTIIDELSYHILKARGFGGNTRSLHVILKEKFRNKLAKVYKKRVVKTGTYTPGGNYRTAEDYEYDPPFLSMEKSHVLLNLDIFKDDEMWSMYSYVEENIPNFRFGFEIDDINVELVEKT